MKWNVAIVLSLSLFLQFIAEFDLRSVQYEVKSPRCHEMRLATPPHDCIRFNFRCDREAEEWATVVMSSLREAHRGQIIMCFFCYFTYWDLLYLLLSGNHFAPTESLYSFFFSGSCKYCRTWFGWQKAPHSSSHRAVEHSLFTTHWLVPTVTLIWSFSI